MDSYVQQSVFGATLGTNNLKKYREDLMMSKIELARKANVSPITIGRIEQSTPCQMKRLNVFHHATTRTQ